jgi:hypothetical protein
MKKLTLRKARILFKKGKTVYLKPSKLSVQVMELSPWFSWFPAKKSDYYQENPSFDKLINEFYYYNCNKEVGLRVHYYAYP